MATDTKNTKELYNTEIPSNWKIKKLGALVEIVSGVSPSLFNLDVVGKYPYLKVEDLNNCEKYQVSSREFSNDEKQLVPKNSVIFPKRGAAILNNKVRINSVAVQMDSNLMAIYPKSEDLSFEYLYYQITFEQLHKIADTSTIPQINNKHIIPYSFPLPPLPEQKAIAQVLSTADAAIHTTEKLIAQKELRKKWLMQQLLTGKKRLKGFGGEWKEQKLEYFIQDYKQKPTDEDNYEVLTSAKAGLMKQTDYYGENRITNRDDADYNVIPPNYLTYRSRSDDGLFTFNKNDLGITGLISGYYPVFTIKNGDINFILMNMNYYRQKLTKYAIGTSQLVLAMNALKEAKINLPLEEEQTAIAQVLQAADKEISLLKAKAEKLREQKKGLMQVLLTGKVRLKI